MTILKGGEREGKKEQNEIVSPERIIACSRMFADGFRTFISASLAKGKLIDPKVPEKFQGLLKHAQKCKTFPGSKLETRIKPKI